jgi:hypothetical protein
MNSEMQKEINDYLKSIENPADRDKIEQLIRLKLTPNMKEKIVGYIGLVKEEVNLLESGLNKYQPQGKFQISRIYSIIGELLFMVEELNSEGIGTRDVEEDFNRVMDSLNSFIKENKSEFYRKITEDLQANIYDLQKTLDKPEIKHLDINIFDQVIRRRDHIAYKVKALTILEHEKMVNGLVAALKKIDVHLKRLMPLFKPVYEIIYKKREGYYWYPDSFWWRKLDKKEGKTDKTLPERG